MAETGPGVFHDSIGQARQVLALAGAAGADARKLAREAGLPGWMLASDEARVPSAQVFRLWELAEQAIGDPVAGLTVVRQGLLLKGIDPLKYLFSTAATVGEALRACGEYGYMHSTSGRVQVAAADGAEVTYSYRTELDGGRGQELDLQFIIAGCCNAIRAAAVRPVVPVRAGFSQPAPGSSYHQFAEVLGTSRIDFCAPGTTVTFRVSDLEVPMRGADPALARILRQYTAPLPEPPPIPWLQHFRGIVIEVIRDGTPSLDAMAGRLSVSRRTLQRQLGEHGTTWRAELDAARQRIAARAGRNGALNASGLARQLGFSEPRAARRFLRRVDGQGRGGDVP